MSKWSREYYLAHRDRILAANRKYASTHREKLRELRAARRAALLERFGGKCVRCGFDDHRALQLDHVQGNGRAELRTLGNSWNIYKRAEAHPADYQLLCANCNWIKRAENDETRRQEDIFLMAGDDDDDEED